MAPPHILMVTLPAKSHVNPSLCFAHRLIRTTGARVTFVTCLSYFSSSSIIANHNNLSILTFSDGFDQGGVSNAKDADKRFLNMETNGDKTLSDFIEANKKSESPVTCLVHTLFLYWAPKVAYRFNLPCALLWIQPALAFDLYYNHFNGDNNNNNVGFHIPNLSPMTTRDLPSFILPSETVTESHTAYQETMKLVKQETNPKILVSTFESLEPEALKAIPNIKMVDVGPLLPSDIFLKSSSRSVMTTSDDESSCYTHWLDSKTESSVIYVSFGTYVELSKRQIEELARALIEGKRPFFWVITDKPSRERKIEGEDETEIEKIAGLRQELEEVGMIVSWCSQIEVLRHKAIGCFVTHCGWSSTLESLVLGVPVVAFPMWSDQPTNAKLLEESWKTGVRVRENEDGLVERGEIRRCLEEVMEEKAETLRENAEKWKRLAVEAGGEGGTSDKNIKAFVDEICQDQRLRDGEEEVQVNNK